MLLASVDTDCLLEPITAVFRTKDVSKLSWDYVATTQIDEYNATNTLQYCLTSKRGFRTNHRNERQPGSSKQSFNLHDAESEGCQIYSGLDETFQAFTAALKLIKSKTSSSPVICEFCGKRSHVANTSFFNPSNPTNKFSQEMLEGMVVRKGMPTTTLKESEPSSNEV